MRKIGEDLIMEKINKIFDEVGGDRQDFEESYISITNSASKGRRATKNSFVGGANQHDVSHMSRISEIRGGNT